VKLLLLVLYDKENGDYIQFATW